ncbi:uncharacterized protein TNCV_2971261 [Trichonephila clavipes]|nr:uncharacterized protein TNCV_2971261 [Trichonephila clavipes]
MGYLFHQIPWDICFIRFHGIFVSSDTMGYLFHQIPWDICFIRFHGIFVSSDSMGCGVKDIISNFESSQKRKLKTRNFEEGTKNTHEKVKADEKTDIKNAIQVEQNDELEDGEQNNDNMLVDEKNGDYLNEEQKYPPWGASAVEQYKGNQSMDVSKEENQDNQETMNTNYGEYGDPPEGSNTNGTLKRDLQEGGNTSKKIRTEMVSKKYPKGSKIKYYDRFRRQIRHQQRLRGYVHLYLGTPTVMGGKYDWAIKNYPRDNLKLKEPFEDEMKKDTWKLVILKDQPEDPNNTNKTT